MGTSKKVVLVTMFLTCAVVMSATACSFMPSDVEVTEPETTEMSTVMTTEPSVRITENSVEVTIAPTETTETTVKVEEIAEYYVTIGFAYKETVTSDELMSIIANAGSGEVYDALVAAGGAVNSDLKITQTSYAGASNLDVSFSDGTKTRSYESIGEYSEILSVSNNGKVIFNVTVEVCLLDVIKPAISGVKDLTCEVGTVIKALDGVSAQDAHDGSVKVSVNEYNTSNVGDFALTYTATDEAGNTETMTAKLTVNAVPVVTEIACDKTMYVTSGTLNIRDAASTDGNKIGSMSYRDSVHVIASVVGSNWVKVEYNGIVGYSSSGYLSDTKPAVSQPTSGTTAGTTTGTTQTDTTQAEEPTQGTTSGGDIPVWTPETPPQYTDPPHGY